MSTAAPGRRHPRVNDVLLIVLAAASALLSLRVRLLLETPAPPWPASVDVVVVVAACLVLWWRRRWPVAVAVALGVLSAVVESAAMPSLAALFTVAVHCSARTTAVLTAANLLALGVYYAIYPVTLAPVWALALYLVSLYGAAVAWGMFVRSRRQLVASLRERAVMAETQAELRAERSQHEARESLAREMHDVLGHRLSLLSVHAGALAYRPDAPPEDTARVAEVIRENAHRALQDLREVIGVLRAPVGELPLPGVGDVADLIEESRRAGADVELRDDDGVAAGERPVTDTVGRTLYRFVQEGLTNARKHAPGAPVVVRIAVGPGDRLVAEVENPGPARTPMDAAGSGEGLRGLAERATLVGGDLDHGPTAGGGWRLGMRLPWPT